MDDKVFGNWPDLRERWLRASVLPAVAHRDAQIPSQTTSAAVPEPDLEHIADLPAGSADPGAFETSG